MRWVLSIEERLESSFAYINQFHTRQNRRSREYELGWRFKRPEKDSVCTGFSACMTGMNRMKVRFFMHGKVGITDHFFSVKTFGVVYVSRS